MEEHIVYCYTSPSGKKYIGITSKRREKTRKKDHKSYAEKGIGLSFHQAIRKYGWENFKYEVLCYVSSRETACLMEKALIKEFDTYYNGYNNTLGGDGVEGVFRLRGEESPLATTKEHYLENSVERKNFQKVCENKKWNVNDFIEVKDFIKSEKHGSRFYYFYIYKYNHNILTSYEEVEEFISNTKLCNQILSIDKSIELCDISQEIWSKCYSSKNFHNIANNILYQYCCYHSIQNYRYITHNQLNIEDEIILKEVLDFLKKTDETIYNCLYYYFINNMTYKEISKIVGISFNSVKNKIDKGLEMISNM